MNTKILDELSSHFNKKVSFDMIEDIRPFELKHIKRLKTEITNQDNRLITYIVSILDLDDEVIIRKIEEITLKV
jgi:hypothetical protein